MASDSAVKEERIVAAAVRADIVTLSVPSPGRHHHVLHAMARLGMAVTGPEAQGFITNRGRFVDRKEGLWIAQKADQIKEKQGNPNILFSEDLW